MFASLCSTHKTPVRRSPQILACLLLQPSLVSSVSLGTPNDHHKELQPIKEPTFLETLAEAVTHLDSLHFNCGEKPMLVVTQKKLHEHPSAGYISRIRLVLDNIKL